MSITVHGIANCDTVKNARGWLDTQKIGYTFRDFKKVPPQATEITDWLRHTSWEVMLNRAGTTFRKLAEADKRDLDQDKAVALMIAFPSMIKRPVVEHPAGLLVGFAPEAWGVALT